MAAIKEFTEGVREFTDDRDHHEAADALGELLSGTTTVEDTAKIITMIYGVSLKQTKEATWMDEHNKPFYFWGHHIGSAVRSFAGDEVQEQRLLDLLVEMSKQPDVRTSDGSLKKHGDVLVYWHDLPGLSFNIIDHLDYNHPSIFRHSDGSDGSDFLAQGPGFLIATKFAASLLKRAAVTWMLVAGEAVFDHCSKEEIFPVGIDSQGRTITSHMQCWADWKNRFQEFAVDEDISDECQNLTFRAANKMMEVEAGYPG